MTDLQSWLAADILSLGMAADEARRATSGSVVTYLRAHTVTAADVDVGAPVPEAASEVRLYEMPTSLDEALAQLQVLKERARARRVVAYSMSDIEDRAREGWGALDDVLKALVAAGLSDVAEMPADRLPALAESMRALVKAGAQPRRVTVSQPVGDWKLEILDRVRQCRTDVSLPLSFSPLPRHAPIDKPTTGYEDLRMVALARLALSHAHGGSVPPRIEVDWTLYGPKLAQVALTFGADHLDAVAATSDNLLGPRRATVADVERNIRAAGFEPQEYRPTR